MTLHCSLTPASQISPILLFNHYYYWTTNLVTASETGTSYRLNQVYITDLQSLVHLCCLIIIDSVKCLIGVYFQHQRFLGRKQFFPHCNYKRIEIQRKKMTTTYILNTLIFFFFFFK